MTGAGARVRRIARSVGSGPRELAVALAAYGVYGIVKGVFAGSLAAGVANARDIVDAERALGVLVEADVQGWFVGNGVGMPFWNWFYLASQVVVLPATLVLVFLTARHAYAHLRNLAITAWCLGLVWYTVQPVAPPRHVGAGIADTISAQTAFDLDGGFARFFYNPVAAMPSLHVGMAPVVGWALWRLTPWWWSRALGVAYPVVVALTVVVTGNHWILDIAGGLAVVGLAALVTRAVTGPVPPAPPRDRVAVRPRRGAAAPGSAP